jgi:hypothetical protein
VEIKEEVPCSLPGYFRSTTGNVLCLYPLIFLLLNDFDFVGALLTFVSLFLETFLVRFAHMNSSFLSQSSVSRA